MRDLWKTGAAAVAALALLGAGEARAQKSKDTLRFAQPVALDVVDAYYTTQREILLTIGEMVWDTLVYSNPDTNGYQGLLAKSWSWPSETTLELELREGVTWHDGQPFTADDVVYTFAYILDPQNKTTRQSNYNWVKSAEKLGPHKVRLTLHAPFGAAIEMLSGQVPIVPNGFYGPGGVAGANGRLVGTGPYRIASFTKGKEVRLEINRGYFAESPKGKPSIGKLEYRYMPEMGTQIAELLSGGVDWIWRVPDEQAEQLGRRRGVTVVQGPSMRVNGLAFDAGGTTGEGPMKDIRVRRAIAHAIDRETITRELISKNQTTLRTPCYESQFGCPKASELAQYDYDPAKAKQLLAEAGFPNGFRTVMYANDSRPVPVMEALQGYMRRVGVVAEIRKATSKVLFDATRDGLTPLYYFSHGSYNINDVSGLFPTFFDMGSRDIARDQEVVDWVAAAGATTDEARRRELYAKASKKIMEQVYWLPLFVDAITYAYTSDLDFRSWGDENPRFFLAKWK